jgi:hypothetical protein
VAPAAERIRCSGIFRMSGKSVLNGAGCTQTAQVIASAEARDAAVAGLKGDNKARTTASRSPFGRRRHRSRIRHNRRRSAVGQPLPSGQKQESVRLQ